MRSAVRRLVCPLGILLAPILCDLSIARGDCPPTDCGPGPCVSIKAVAVNGNPITPTNCVNVMPGDQIETELYVSGWGTALPLGLRVYQLNFAWGNGAASGTMGVVTPEGWDAPITISPFACVENLDCPIQFPICHMQSGQCHGANHDPETGAYIETSHPQFVLAGLEGIFAVDVQSLFYRYLGLTADSAVPDTGTHGYAGTLLLHASGDAFGSFEFDFSTGIADGNTFFGDPSPKPIIVVPDSVPLVVNVCQDDALFCNGLETFDPESGCVVIPPNCDDNNDCTTDSCNEVTDSCDHVATCGACCDSWIGECNDAVAPEVCVCSNCIWSGGADCADVECEAQFVAIPAVSEWGLVILTLTLLVAAKIRFRRGTESVI